MHIKIEGDFTGKCFDGGISLKGADMKLMRQFFIDCMPSLINTVFKNILKNLEDTSDESVAMASLMALTASSNVAEQLTSTVNDFLGGEFTEEDDEEEDDYDDECGEGCYCEDAVKKNFKSNKKKK